MEIRPELEDLNIFHYIGVLLAVISGGVHLYLVPSIGFSSLGIGFLIAGIGFFTGSLAILYDFNKSLTYLIGIPFTAGQIILWYYLNRPSLELFLQGKPLLDFIDKVSQTMLLAVLIYLYFEGE